ncbi:MAG: ABC transporter substrate-binding protein [Alphaproteobacteria bacterium]|jgi:ribose transport system substrate-binding protein|nr:ABC transporter substrate-binding protein [Alphaproteobacteria bacterium]MBU0802836.1 ABC transporter substrate-binding protein [Alphaproteobacteria bacterium]MBU0871633.1 ABC transporter substrate-binding protein [Alphaproteobacteria bacterium]MBU1400300.1 ABC transporter substrate-binding protein [Alphaproteobacteria bacterium]MBU1591420.1 ABC transporter substrate-binding protein [Alphaproteobacteria bacterium]
MAFGSKALRLALLAGMAAGSLCASTAAQAAEKYKIYLSMSFIGNDWQAEAANMVKAMAAHKSMADKVDLQVQVAGPNAQRQIQQINAMVQAGAQAIVIFPISPTALNQVVKNACDKGVKVFAYDAEITEPCAYNIHIDQEEAGRVTAEWLVDKLGGKGEIIAITGVPGTSVDDQRTKAAKEVFAKHPDIKIVGEAVGMWSQAVARTELSKILATRTWDDIDGLWMQVGCFTANAMQLEAGKTPADLLPCAGEGANGGRIQMLPEGTEVEGASSPYAPLGAPRISYASPPYSGALALKLAVEALEGKDVPKLTVLPLPVVTSETVKLCEEGTWDEMKAGCNAFKPALVSNPGWFASIFSDQTPEVGLNAALVGQPED